MKVTVWGINYAPELVGIGVYNTELCEFLSAAGHEVTMVTTFPYYPTWKKRAQDAFRLYQTQRTAGVTIHRCWHYVPPNPTALRRIVHEASFALTSLLKILTLSSPDVMIVVGPPLAIGVFAWLASVIKRAPFLYHLQDLQPDAALGVGMLKPGLLVDMLFLLQRFAYSRSRKVSSISHKMCQAIVAQGVPEKKVVLLPNWVKVPDLMALPPPGTWKQKNGISKETCVISYAGSLGAKQGWKIVVDAALLLQRKDRSVVFVIAGNGSYEAECKQLCQDSGLTNVRFESLLPEADHTALIIDSDICLIPQKPGSSGAFLPSKLLKILALGRPVVTNPDEDSALHAAVLEGLFGVLVKPGDANALANAIGDLLDDAQQRQRLAEGGRRYATQFEKDIVLSRIESVIGGLKNGLEVEPQCT